MQNTYGDGRVLPPHVIEFLEWLEDGGPLPVMATAWIDTDRRQPRFAALQYIDNCYWLVHGELAPAPVTGMLRLRRFTIEPWKHDREVTGRILRKLRPADIRNHALARISAEVGVDEFRNLSDEERRARRELARSAVAPARRGRRGYDAEHWRIITRAYLEIAATPGQREIYRTLGRRLKVAPELAKEWVKLARRRGFLTAGERGRPGGRPGPRYYDYA